MEETDGSVIDRYGPLIGGDIERRILVVFMHIFVVSEGVGSSPY